MSEPTANGFYERTNLHTCFRSMFGPIIPRFDSTMCRLCFAFLLLYTTFPRNRLTVALA